VWSWSTTGYAPATTLETGVGYWVFNRTTSAVVLAARSTGAAISMAREAALATTKSTAAGVVDAAATSDAPIQPPAPPTSIVQQGGSHDSQAGSGACGLGSALGFVIMAALGLWRRRKASF
jgi:hypothetical protein